MDNWTSLLKADSTLWLLELDNPSVRYFTLTDLLERPPPDAEVRQAKAAIMASEPVRKILDAQYPDGYWIKPGIGYSPKCRATVWQVIFLADLGATRTEQIEKACQHIFQHAQRPDGAFIANKGKSGAVICLNGNLLRSLLWFGYGDAPHVQRGLAWLRHGSMETKASAATTMDSCLVPGVPSRPCRPSLPCQKESARRRSRRLSGEGWSSS